MQDLSHNTTVVFMLLPHQNLHIYHIHHQKLLGNISELYVVQIHQSGNKVMTGFNMICSISLNDAITQ